MLKNIGRGHSSGFTLLEMLVVIGIGVVLVVINLNFSNLYASSQRLKGSADLIVQAIEQAELDSFAQRDDATHGVKVLPTSVVRFQGANYASRNQAEDVSAIFPAAISVSATSEITFTPMTPKPSAATTITVTLGSRAIDIIVNTYGIIETVERTI